jgi:hypothetical protein
MEKPRWRQSVTKHQARRVTKEEDAFAKPRAFFMAYIRREARKQTTMFPLTLHELIPGNRMCRVGSLGQDEIGEI